ncbi:MAG: hypothetical protein HN377_13345, partial [Alphaproteobacteria bacterium]|nr:hypothetical protein [Alphaproteobacteria bacterium]
MAKKKSSSKGATSNADALMRSLFKKMEAEKSAEGLNDNVIIPFCAALEEVCEARGYVLNIFGDKSNLVFTGDEKDAAAIYTMIED